MESGLDYDDVLLIPKYSELESRIDPNVETFMAKDYKIAHPIIPANMDCIAGKDMREVQSKNGGGFIWHRHHKQLKDTKPGDFFTIGMRNWYDDQYEWINHLEKLVGDYDLNICIDIAHAHAKGVLDASVYIKNRFPSTKLIVGNIATGEAAKALCDSGVDGLKVGIGGGYACTTRKVTGCGVPNLTAIQWAYDVARNYDVPIIADGGIKDSNDIAKALGAGASAVMVGRVLAGTEEAQGDVAVDYNGKGGWMIWHVWLDGKHEWKSRYPNLDSMSWTDIHSIFLLSSWNTGGHGLLRRYWGQSSEEFQNKHYGGMKDGIRAEGEELFVPFVGPAQRIIDNMIYGLKSSMTYVGAKNIELFTRKAEFIIV